VAYFDPKEWQALDRFPARDIAITSGFELRPIAEAPENAFRLSEVPNVAVVVERAVGEKCARCWMVLEEVISHPKTHLCDRCTDAVAALPKKDPA
jgi:isoleucyl-tRNA synthetase